MIEKNHPLVSIVIITYNSAEFIIECLESIETQTYQNIELIISDDCSSDKTVNICKKWLKKNRERFINTELIEAHENTGITKNINRGCKAAKGAWIKPLGGDDLLLPHCIEKNILHSANKKIIFSQVEMFSRKENLGLHVTKNGKKYFELPAKEQFEILMFTNFVPTTSVFLNSEFLKAMNYYDETYSMIEDYPFWILSTYNGIKLNYFDDVTVRYRIHQGGISSRKKGSFYSVNIYNSKKAFILDFIKYNYINICLRINVFFMLLIEKKTILHGNNLKAYNKYVKLRYLNPCAYLKKIKELW